MSWQTVKLGDVCDVRDGTHDSPKYIESGYPLITSKNLVAGFIDKSNVSYISEEDYKNICKRSKVDFGDILMPMIGTIGNPVIVNEKQPDFAIKNVALIKFNKESPDRSFIKLVLNGQLFHSYIQRSSKGGTQKFLSLGDIRKFPFPLPPLAEQKRIAAILDKADEIKRKREQAIAKLDQLAQSIFVEMFGNIANNDKGWEIVELSNHVSKLGSGSTPTGGDAAYKANGISLIRSLNVHDGVFKLKSLAFIDDIQASKLSNVEVKDGDVLLNITGASVARVCRVPSLILPARVNQHVMIIRLDKTINNIFFEKLLVDKQMKSKLLTIAGSGATREAITKAQMQELKIIFPPLALQEQFATRISKLEKLKASNIAALEKHNQLFASLQNQAFTGQL